MCIRDRLTRDYGDKESRVIQNTVGNVFSGQVVGETAKIPVSYTHLVNLPTRFYYKKKWNNGYINVVNVFRASIVLGTPGRGK